jgi:Uma2 family endonuclease
MAVQPKTRITAADYYQLAEYEQHELIQLIDGEVIIGMPPILKHQRLVRDILYLLTTIARHQGGEAFDSPTEVYFDENNVFQPDVLYITPDTTCIAEDKRLIGAPDLVVEVLSPSTAKFDRQEKYKVYEKHGVREYWIVDAIHEVLEVWTLNDKQFIRQGAYGEDDTFQSQVLGTSIEVKQIFRS